MTGDAESYIFLVNNGLIDTVMQSSELDPHKFKYVYIIGTEIYNVCAVHVRKAFGSLPCRFFMECDW